MRGVAATRLLDIMPKARGNPGNNVRRRPRQRRSQLTVDAILTAAAQVLEAHGVEGTNTNRISAVAGVSIGTLYQYFPDKGAVLAALLARERNRSRDAVLGAIREHQQAPIETAIRAALRAALDAARAHASIHEALFHEVAARIGDARGGALARRVLESDVRGFLETRRDEIQVDDVARAAFTIVQSVNALAHEATVAPRAELRGEALVDEAVALIVGYLRAARAPVRASRGGGLAEEP